MSVDEPPLQTLVWHLQDEMEAGKKRLARTLHDELGGLLAAVKIDVVWLRRRLDQGDPDTAVRWARIIRCLDQGLQFKSRIIEDLRPTLLDNLGLVEALGQLVGESCNGTQLKCLERYPEQPTPLDDTANISLYRIAQRALEQVCERAVTPALATLSLREAVDGVELEIRGEGLGPPPHRADGKRSLELLALQQRLAPLGGVLTTTSAESTLTVRAWIPRRDPRPTTPMV